jgi:hypothetical protein
MRHSVTAIGAAFLLGFTSLLGSTYMAFAQQSQANVRRQLENQAFPEGTSAQAMKDGKHWTVVVDSQGKIVQRDYSGGLARQNNGVP